MTDTARKDPADYASADGKGYANGWNAALKAVDRLTAERDAQAARIDKALAECDRIERETGITTFPHMIRRALTEDVTP